MEKPASDRSVAVEVLGGTYAICRLEAGAGQPAWLPRDGLTCVTRTVDELSVVCRQSAVPTHLRCERDWRCLRVVGPIDFGAVGVLATLTGPLAEAGVSVFVVSTFDTDYLLVRAADLPRAVAALETFGHTIASVRP